MPAVAPDNVSVSNLSRSVIRMERTFTVKSINFFCSNAFWFVDFGAFWQLVSGFLHKGCTYCTASFRLCISAFWNECIFELYVKEITSYSKNAVMIKCSWCLHLPQRNDTLYKQEAFEKPIRYCEPRLHCQSPGVASRTPAIAIMQEACDVHDNNNDNAWQRGPLQPHGMGQINLITRKSSLKIIM